MKSKLTRGIFALFTALILTASFTFAASLELKKIGSLDLGGQKYPEWWYSGIKPMFEGTAEDDADVDVQIGETIYPAKANSSGFWSVFIPLEQGDYNVAITSGDESYSFKLHLGQSYPGSGGTTQTTGSTATVPTTGVEQTTALALGTGVSLLALYFYFFDSNRKRKTFEKNIVSGR